MKYPRTTAWIEGSAWALLPSKLEAIVAALEALNGGAHWTPEQLAARGVKPPAPAEPTVTGRIGVLPLLGVITQRADLFSEASGGTTTERWSAQFAAMTSNPEVSAIVLDVDSPGGNVYGIQELAGQIRAAAQRGKPRIVAVANSLAASAAYWLASQASKLYVTPGGEVGSIGVVAIHSDYSGADQQAGVRRTILTAGRYKAEGNPLEPLSAEARDFIQTRLDDYYKAFIDGVAAGRGVSTKRVLEQYGEGRVFGAAEAMSRGMVDGVKTLPEVISGLARKFSAQAGALAG